MKHSLFALVVLVLSQQACSASAEGKYCELEGARTADGKAVTGSFYMYSDKYGEADSAFTEDYEPVYGECYRYSESYCELEGARTRDGVAVYGECYIYD